MSVHHYKLAVVPRAYFGQQSPVEISEAEVDRGEDAWSGWWAAHPPTEQFLSGIRALMPHARPWPGGDVEEYVGSGDWGSDIRIWKDAGRVWGITFRFSPVADDWSLMQRFLALTQNEQCLLLDERSGAVFEPDEKIVRERLVASRAMQFVHDPQGTIVQTAKELKDDAG
jgi:hypothetical protein